jgi:hypothetical protein
MWFRSLHQCVGTNHLHRFAQVMLLYCTVTFPSLSYELFQLSLTGWWAWYQFLSGSSWSTNVVNPCCLLSCRFPGMAPPQDMEWVRLMLLIDERGEPMLPVVLSLPWHGSSSKMWNEWGWCFFSTVDSIKVHVNGINLHKLIKYYLN